MASLKYFIPPGTSETLFKMNYYSQAVRIPGTPLVKCSGQGGVSISMGKIEIRTTRNCVERHLTQKIWFSLGSKRSIALSSAQYNCLPFVYHF